MNIYVLDTNLNPISIIDEYESFIWTDRYCAYGDFELYTPIDDDVLKNIKQDYYLVNNESEHLMIIEKILIESNVETGNHVTISGRSIESLLNRRIVWGLKTLSGNLQNSIQTLLNENVITPSISERKISNFVFSPSTDLNITSLTINTQFTGDNLYEVICKLCSDNKLGFKVILTDDNKFQFSLFKGIDRSYDQTANPYVIFSPNFENIVNSRYIESKSNIRNVSLVGGEGDGDARTYTVVGNESGLNRRELFTDARDLSSETVGTADYISILNQRGKDKLQDYKDIMTFEGQVEMTNAYLYREDFYIGDIVQVADEYGHETSARIIEFVISENEREKTFYPTFETIEN